MLAKFPACRQDTDLLPGFPRQNPSIVAVSIQVITPGGFFFPLATWFAAGHNKYSSTSAHFNTSTRCVEIEQTKDSQAQDTLWMAQEPGTARLTAALLLSQLDLFPSTITVLNMGMIRIIAHIFCNSFDFRGVGCGSQHLSLYSSPHNDLSALEPHANSRVTNNIHITYNKHVCRYTYQSPLTKMPRPLT